MNERSEEQRKRCIKVHEDRGDFVIEIDGFVKFWPGELPGFLEAHHLRWIADELDAKNKDWNKKIDEYFKENE